MSDYFFYAFMKKKIIIAVITFGISCILAFSQESKNLSQMSLNVLIQKDDSSTLSSFGQAFSIVENSLRAMGFDKNNKDLKSLSFEFEGNVFWRHQGLKLLPQYDSTPLTAKLVYDIANSRLAYESTQESPGGFKNHRRLVREKKGGFNADFYRGRMQELPNSTPEDLRYVLDRIPHLVLRRIMERPTSLRLVGKANFKNRPHDVVTALFGNTTANFYFDEKTALLSKYEFLIFDAFEGDVIQERIFEDYQPIKGVMFPTIWRQTVANTLGQEYRYKGVEIDPPIDESFFKAPELPKYSESSSGIYPKVSEIASGVFFLERIAFPYNLLFVEFADYIVVVEAPVSSDACQRAIEIIKKTIPNKPIRYVIPTHHHDDHAGGLRPFVAEGATILTTPKNKSFFEAMMQAKFISQPDSLSRAPRPAKIEIIKDAKFVLTDGKQKLELYNIGLNPHTEEMLIAYLPQNGLVFQADLWHGLPVNKTGLFFLEWLKKSKLSVQKIYGVHNEGITLEEIAALMAK